MTLLVMPTLSCNLKCLYCYNRKIKGFRIELTKYDARTLAEKAIALAKMTGHNEIVLHGGEPLLWGVKKFKRFAETVTKAGLKLAIQTNATLISDEYIKVFKQYNVSIGVSIDGFPDIGYTRGYWNIDGEPLFGDTVNRRIVSNVLKNIEKMVKSGINVGIIIVLHKYNFGDDDKIRRLAEFILYLKKIGISSGRLNPAFGFGKKENYELDWKDLLYGYEKLWYLIRDYGVAYTPYTDFTRVLLGDFRNTTCWFHGCGFWDSHVYTILPNGSIAPCDRVLWHGKTPLRVDEVANPIMNSKIRTYALLQTELRNSKNGHLHRGGCPAESPDGDWRRASRFWRTWDEMIDFMAEEIQKLVPSIRLPNGYPDKLDFVKKVDSGCVWNIWEGRLICPESN